MTASVFDDRTCELGEGPLRHPERKQLFWFDIMANTLHTRTDAGPQSWDFGERVSAAGWVDQTTLLVASETKLQKFDIETGTIGHVIDLEADNAVTRSNDGRADPFGGFWIGTMGKSAEKEAGSIYRYYRGELRKLFGGITIPNSICFAPDGRTAYFTDTPTRIVKKVSLASDGWPDAEPEVFVDLNDSEMNPDGAVTDSEGAVWCAHWGAHCVTRYLPDGTKDINLEVGGAHASCPAFGGDGYKTLFVTTACEGIDNPSAAEGKVYSALVSVAGLPEPRVIL